MFYGFTVFLVVYKEHITTSLPWGGNFVHASFKNCRQRKSLPGNRLMIADCRFSIVDWLCQCKRLINVLIDGRFPFVTVFHLDLFFFVFHHNHFVLTASNHNKMAQTTVLQHLHLRKSLFLLFYLYPLILLSAIFSSPFLL